MEELWYNTKRVLIQLAHFQKRKRVQRYGLPILLTAIVFFIKHYFHAYLGDNSAFLMASFIVAASSWYGGLGPGVLATLLAVSCTYYFFLARDFPEHSFMGDLIVMGIFVIEGIIISISSEARYEMENQKDEFIAFVSHELKNPLAIIMGFSGLITLKAKRSGDEKLQEHGEQITNQSNNILTLINDLLDITKIEIGKFSYVESIFNFDDLVKEVLSRQRVLSTNRLIQLKGHTKHAINGDRNRIAQVVINLVTNALKYSPETKKVVVRVKEKAGNVYLSVIDQGVGIPLDEQGKIFDRFYRARDVAKKKSEGLGLGLYITNQIVKHHHGKIWVESKLGRGSKFHISLPIQQPVNPSLNSIMFL